MAKKKKSLPSEVMVVNSASDDECRIAILENQHLEELYAERIATATNVGNIYKGRVINVEPAIQAAFIDYGQQLNGFLHISDLHPRYFPGAKLTERVGKKIPRRDRPLIQQALKRGDEILVQVLKEGIGTKGPTLTSYLSIPGRLIVLMPEMGRVGVSRKVEDDDVRREMRDVMKSLDLPQGFGFILRTAGIQKSKMELKRDVAYLMRLWKAIERRIEEVPAPCELYTESDLLTRTIRDVLRPGIEAIVVDSEAAYQRAEAFLQVVAPRSAPKLIHYRKATPIFHAFDIERQIDLIHSRHVPLPSGGELVIDQTEALVAIDVNSGRSRRAKDSETNAFETNLEAVDEICRQLRLRDLGGLIVNDLIDMRLHQNRRKIEDRFFNNLKRDRAKTTTVRISSLGLLEMTRQRMRPSMRSNHFVDCTHCHGRGEIKAPESVSADVTRQVGYLLQTDRIYRVEIVCSPRVASVLLSKKRRDLVELEDKTRKIIDVRVSDAISDDRVDFYAYDDRNADVNIAQLPTVRIPALKDLEKLQEVVESSELKEPEEQQVSPDKSQPADALNMVISGELDGEEDEKAAETQKQELPERKTRRRRRRSKTLVPDTQSTHSESEDHKKEPSRGRKRRRRKKPAQSTDQKVASKTDKESKIRESSIRVYSLAKELKITSRDILKRCKEDGSIPLKNHMSSLTSEQADAVSTWFKASAETSSESEQDISDTRGKSSRRRRSRRGGRSRTNSTASKSDEKDIKSEIGEKHKKKSTRKKKQQKKKKATSATHTKTSDAKEGKPDSAPVNGESSPVILQTPRRSLYRSRKRIDPATVKEAAEAAEA